MLNHWVVEPASSQQTDSLAELLLASSPNLLSHILSNGNKTEAKEYLRYALALPDGQYGYLNHKVIKYNDSVIGIACAWHNQLPNTFDQCTIDSLHHFFGIQACLQIFKRSSALLTEIARPSSQQLVIGHVSTDQNFRRRGVATALLDYFIQRAKTLAKEQLVVDVEKQNIQALKCYLSLGFKHLNHNHNKPFLRLTKPVIPNVKISQ